MTDTYALLEAALDENREQFPAKYRRPQPPYYPVTIKISPEKMIQLAKSATKRGCRVHKLCKALLERFAEKEAMIP